MVEVDLWALKVCFKSLITGSLFEYVFFVLVRVVDSVVFDSEIWYYPSIARICKR